MLKIKDNVDLKELEKYGFEQNEILDYLNKFINDKEEITKYGCEISAKEAKVLLDYITNLQEENNYFNKKNIELSTLNTSLRTDRDNYKSRIDKAIEYINWFQNYSIPKTEFVDGNKVKDILQGSDKE